jgi:hypothetical protein
MRNWASEYGYESTGKKRTSFFRVVRTTAGQIVSFLLPSRTEQNADRSLRMSPVAISEIITRSVNRLSPSPIPVEVVRHESVMVQADDEPAHQE